MGTDRVCSWLEFFEYASCFFRKIHLSHWNRYPNYLNDIWDSTALFLDGYAFERQGRPLDYAHAAVDALLQYKQQNNNQLGPNAPNDIWNIFSGLLGNIGANPKNNPLYPSTNPLSLSNFNNNFLSVIELIINNNIQNNSFVNYLGDLIINNNDVEPAHRLLKRIRGISDKIASLFLRDIIEVTNIGSNINLVNIKNRELLQPVDTWVRNTVQILTGDNSMNDKQIRSWIVCNSRHCKVSSKRLNPEKVNMGMWFFGADVVRSKYKLRNMLNRTPSDARKELKGHIRNILHLYANACTEC